MLQHAGGAYQVNEARLTAGNAEALTRGPAADGAGAVARIVAIREGSRAPQHARAVRAGADIQQRLSCQNAMEFS
jgi:hypothetical protein